MDATGLVIVALLLALVVYAHVPARRRAARSVQTATANHSGDEAHEGTPGGGVG